MKLNKIMSKKLIVYALISIAVLVIVFGSVAAGYGFFAAGNSTESAKDLLHDYADKLKLIDYEAIKDSVNSPDKPPFQGLNNPNVHYGVYIRNNEGGYDFGSRDRFLMQNQPTMGLTMDNVVTETVGGYSFLTITQEITGGEGNYVKLFMSTDIVNSIGNSQIQGAVIFLITFMLIAIVLLLTLGYVGLRPMIADNLRHKQFINEMAHEIRTPLAVIKGNIENALADTSGDANKVESMLRTCVEEVDYMDNLSYGFLSIVRGHRTTNACNNNISDVVNEVAEMYIDYLAELDKVLTVGIDPCTLAVDGDKIRQLMHIIIDNSVKYTEVGDSIAVSLTATKKSCSITIADSGIGVPKQELASIFDRFYRATNTTNKQGTGLGLAIAKSIVEGMNGKISAQANGTKGLIIHITLPIKQ